MNPTNKSERAKIVAMLKYWLNAGSLVEVEADDEKRRPKTFIEVKEGD
jgi:hypothetical protein